MHSEFGNEIGQVFDSEVYQSYCMNTTEAEAEATMRATLQRSKIALRKSAYTSLPVLPPPAYLTNEGLFICIQESNILQKCATTDLSTWRLLGSICASAK